jgi:hypothetical protein
MIRWIEERTGEPVPTGDERGLGRGPWGLLPEMTFRHELFGLGPFLGEEEGGKGSLFLGETAADRAVQTDFAGDELG